MLRWKTKENLRPNVVVGTQDSKHARRGKHNGRAPRFQRNGGCLGQQPRGPGRYHSPGSARRLRRGTVWGVHRSPNVQFGFDRFVQASGRGETGLFPTTPGERETWKEQGVRDIEGDDGRDGETLRRDSGEQRLAVYFTAPKRGATNCPRDGWIF